MPTAAAKPVRPMDGRLDAFSWAVVAAVVATFALLVAGALTSAHGRALSRAMSTPLLAIAPSRP